MTSVKHAKKVYFNTKKIRPSLDNLLVRHRILYLYIMKMMLPHDMKCEHRVQAPYQP